MAAVVTDEPRSELKVRVVGSGTRFASGIGHRCPCGDALRAGKSGVVARRRRFRLNRVDALTAQIQALTSRIDEMIAPNAPGGQAG
jgi:hypothetical protein